MVILSSRLRFILFALLFFNTSIVNATAPVLLTFDTEKANDEKYLKQLDIKVPATYFFLGKFIEQHSDFVTEISKNNTVGAHGYSHKNLTELSTSELHQELMLTKVLLENATGKAPKWFRAPFLAYNEEVLNQLKALGFLYDSSEQEPWAKQYTLLEMPVSGEAGTDDLVSDYDVFVRDKLSDEQALDWYKQQYLIRAETGRPMVFLLHPSIIIEHKEVLWQFIDFVQSQGGSFISSEQWIEKVFSKTAKRVGVWVDLSVGEHKVDQLVADIKRIGVTDVFLMAKDHDGHTYFKTSTEEKADDIFGDLHQAIQQAGIKVHAWLPALLNPAVAQLHPEWAMMQDNGARSINWLSPFNPEVKFLLTETVKDLLKNYELDGIHLDYIRYPDQGHGYSDASINGFVSLHKEKKIDKTKLLSAHYSDWVGWREQGISQLVKSVKETINQFSNSQIELSAALIAEAAISADTQAKYGQNYRALAKPLDLVIPMAYFKGERRTVEWISKVITSAHYRIGDTKLLMGLAAYQQPKEWKITNKEFENSIKIAEKGTDGLVFYNYLNLFGRGSDSSWDMNADNVQFLAEHFSVNKALADKPFIASVIEENFDVLQRKDTQLLLIGLLFVFLILIFVVYLIRKKGLHGQDFSLTSHSSDDLNLATVNFSEIEEKIDSGRNIKANTFVEISTILKQIGPQRISRFRQVYLLETLIETSKSVNDVIKVITSHGDTYSSLRRIEEAGLLGYLEIDNDSQVSITDLGLKLIKQGTEDGYSKGLIDFLDSRLSENIVISCSRCDAKTLGHWFWMSFECSGCHHKSAVAKAPNIFVKK